MDTEVIKEWLESLEIEETDFIIELLDCPVSGFKAFVRQYYSRDS